MYLNEIQHLIILSLYTFYSIIFVFTFNKYMFTIQILIALESYRNLIIILPQIILDCLSTHPYSPSRTNFLRSPSSIQTKFADNLNGPSIPHSSYYYNMVHKRLLKVLLVVFQRINPTFLSFPH